MEAYLDNSATTKCAREVVEHGCKSNAGRLWQSVL